MAVLSTVSTLSLLDGRQARAPNRDDDQEQSTHGWSRVGDSLCLSHNGRRWSIRMGHRLQFCPVLFGPVE
jgi:hypothetical protein